MVVTCPSCGTRFHLDEARLPGDTAKVRCSICQQVFQVARPVPLTSAPPPEPPPAAPVLDLDTPEEQTASPESPFAPAVAPEPEPAGGYAPAPATPEPLAPPSPQPQETQTAPPTPAPAPRTSRLPLVLAVMGGILLGLALGILSLWVAGAFKLGPWPPATVTSERVIIVPPPLPAGPEDLKGLALAPTEARYRGLVNKMGGQILVIQGEVQNDTPEPRGPIQLKATLTDDQDRLVGERLVYSGTTLSDQELKDLDPNEINRWLDAPGGRDQATRVLPGDKQAFTVVFFGVPADLAAARYGFTVAVVQGPRAPNP